MTVNTLLWVVAAYLIGSLSFAVIVSRAMGLPDPRTFGSKNPGATNMLRTGRKTAALLTLLGDGFKGWFAVWLAGHFGANALWAASFTTTAVVLGHMFPVFFHFQGGKGVATVFGALLGLGWPLALGAALAWGIMALLFRYSSLASLTAALTALMLSIVLAGILSPVFWNVAVTVALVFWRHRSNIQNLLAGTESRLGQKKA